MKLGSNSKFKYNEQVKGRRKQSGGKCGNEQEKEENGKIKTK